VLSYASSGVLDPASARAGARLRAACVLMPLGFLLGVFGQTESDPGPGIWLVPAGAISLVWGLLSVARAALRA
jgi:hypothetical protein